MAKKREARFVISAENKTAATLGKISGDVTKLGGSFVNLARIAVPAIGAIAGGAALKGLASLVKDAADSLDALGETAGKLNLPVDDLQRFQVAAKFAGVESGTLERGLGLLNKNVGNLRAGLDKLDGKAGGVLQSLGLSEAEILGDDLGELFEKIVGGLSKVEDPAERSAKAIALFGKSATDLNLLFEAGAGGLERAATLIRDYGIGLDDLDAEKVGEMNDKFDELALVTDFAKKKLAVELAPAIRDVTGLLLDLAKEGEGIGPAIVEGVRQGVEAMKFLGEAIRLVSGGTSTSSTVATEGGGSLISQRIGELEQLAERVNELRAAGQSITGGGEIDLAREFGNVAEKFTGIMDLEKRAGKLNDEIETLKGKLAELPPITQAQAEAVKRLADVERMRNEGLLTADQAKASAEDIQRGLKNQTEELEWQADLFKELNEREKELQKYNKLNAETQATITGEKKAQLSTQEEIDQLTKEIEAAGGTVLPPKEFELLGSEAAELAHSIGQGPESVTGSLERATIAGTEFREVTAENFQIVGDSVEETLSKMARLFLALEDYGQSVTSNLEGAIDEFTRTGELNMKEFTRSVLADLAAIAAKAAILGGILGNSQYGGNNSGLVGTFLSGIFSGGFDTSGAPKAVPVGSYAGGGFTGYGSRSGGIDGRGGFPAILHPNETVVDHAAGQSLGGGPVTVNQTVIVRETMPAGQARAIINAASGEAVNRMISARERGGARAKRYGKG